MIDHESELLRNNHDFAGDMPTEDFRHYGLRVVEWIGNYLENPRQYPVVAQVNPGELRCQLPTSGPQRGESMAAILEDFERTILPMVTH